MVKVADVAPAATVTVCGTEAAAEFEESVTIAPPAGAEVESVTVPWTVPLPVIDDGENVRL
jgi:hypothetical protein